MLWFNVFTPAASVFYRYNDIEVVLNLVFLAVREYANIKIRMFN